ncbi:hypothetical protein ABMA58_07590 [Oceanospirillum sp. HFRX-1_2]
MINLSGKITQLNAQEIKAVSLTLNGAEQILTRDAENFEAQLSLKPGENSYTIEITDTNDRATSYSYQLYFGNKTAAGNAHSGVLRDGKLFTWGRNNYGQLGLGFTSKLSDGNSHPNTPLQVGLAEDVEFVSIVFNQNSSLALGSQGYAWSWGKTEFGQLGLGETSETEIKAPTKISSVNDVVSVDRGYNHSLMLTQSGTVYAFGKNDKGQLGTGTVTTTDDDQNKSMPTAVAGLSDIIQIAAGANTSYALDSNGTLWGWGSNTKGELGITSTENQSTPVQIPVPSNVAMLAAGQYHALALTRSGELYGWGLNSSSQVYGLDDGSEDDNVLNPRKLDWFDDVRFVWANGNMSFLARSDGKVYPWGQNSLGGLGVISADKNVLYPSAAMPGLSSVTSMGVGALHGIALREDGQVFSWGWSFEGSLGVDGVENAWSQSVPLAVTVP